VDCRDEQIKLLTQTIEELRAELLKRDEEIAELKRHIGLNSKNSSKPPSSDGLKKPPRVQSLREKSDKQSGGQLGHKGTTLKQVENPDLIECHKVNFCPHCSIDLTNEPVVDICKRQVFDIPKIIKPIVTEHQFEIKCCPGCRKKVSTQGDGLVKAPVQYGPHAKAVISYLNAYNLVPEGRTAEIAKDIFGLTVSGSTVENISTACVTNIKPIVEQVEEHLRITPVKGADESGLRVAGKLYWIHALCDDQSVHYRLSKKRGDIKKDLEGIVVHDFFAPYYNKLEKAQHGLCGAHLLRELKAVVEIDKES
jgi:transposase